MNELLKMMSKDMHILCYHNEPEESFVYRLCYSALGQWCLSMARNTIDGTVGTTKHNQTTVLNDLLSRFTELFPFVTDRLIDTNNKDTRFSVSIRRVYEETGYLLTDNDNHNRIANHGRTIRVGDKFLFFGLPGAITEINGFGVYTDITDYVVDMKDFLIRDVLTSDAYLNAQFDLVEFYERDIDLAELEFFNPKSKSAPSKSWEKQPKTDCTIARKTETGPYYRVMKTAEGFHFADELIKQQSDSFTSYEYRRLNFALKSHYDNPLTATITKLDASYSKIHIGGHLPNREYYLLLLMSWPERNAFDKVNFIIKNDLLAAATNALAGIGIEIKGE